MLKMDISLPPGMEYLLEYLFAIWVPFCYIVVIIFRILLALWVRSDAKRRGMNASWWVFVVLVSGLFGVVVYFLVCFTHGSNSDYVD